MRKTILLAKFGKREHLEMLKDGLVYFSPLRRFREDESNFRGDKNEGGIPINPKSLKIQNKDGKDLFADLGLPYPDRAIQTLQGDDNLFMFYSAKIDNNNLMVKNACEFVLSNEFKDSIKQFGDTVLLFTRDELLDKVNEVQKSAVTPFGYIADSVIYRDLDDFSDNDEFRKAYSRHKGNTNQYFVKDINYKSQNEWRIIIDGSETSLNANCGEGYSLQIKKLEWAHLFSTIEFLNGFSVYDDMLNIRLFPWESLADAKRFLQPQCPCRFLSNTL